MDVPQANIPHRMVTEGAGHVAKRTEVAASQSGLNNNDLKTLLREVKGHRGTLGPNSSLNGRSRVNRRSNCSSCSNQGGPLGPVSSIGSYSGADSGSDTSSRKWASTTDIFKAYSDPIRTSTVERKNNATNGIRTTSLRVKTNKPEHTVRFASVRRNPKQGMLLFFCNTIKSISIL